MCMVCLFSMSTYLSYICVPSLSSLYIKDGRLPDVGNDYSRISRPKSHRWSPEEKQVLFILNKYYANKSVDLWKIFCAHFQKRYQRLPKPRRTAWESMRNFNAHPSRYIVSWSLATTERLRVLLEHEASTINIILLPSAQNCYQKKTLVFKRRRFTPTPSASSSSLEAISTQKALAHPVTPDTQRLSQWNGLLTPPSSGQITQKRGKQSVIHRQIPRIAFRGELSELSMDGSLYLTLSKLSVHEAKA